MRRFSGSRAPRLKVESRRQEPMSADTVVKAFAGEGVGQLKGQVQQGDLLAVRDVLAERLRSSGGRPKLEGAEKHKIPVFDDDWRWVNAVTASLASEHQINATPAQVSGVIFHLARQRLSSDDVAAEVAAMTKAG
jgi:hypothetical protein